jgi:hypothetical protein
MNNFKSGFISSEEFQTKYANLYSSIFVKKIPLVGNPFKNKDWDFIIIENEGYLLEGYTDAFDKMLRFRGEKNIIMHAYNVLSQTIKTPDGTVLPLDEKSYVTEYEYNKNILRGIETNTFLGHREKAVFGLSGKSRVVADVLEYCYIGGEPELMDVFYKELGGKEKLLQDYLRFAKEGWIFINSNIKQRAIKQAEGMLKKLSQNDNR